MEPDQDPCWMQCYAPLSFLSKIGRMNYSQFHSLTYAVQKKQNPVASHCRRAYFTQTGYHMLVNLSAFSLLSQLVTMFS